MARIKVITGLFLVFSLFTFLTEAQAKVEIGTSRQEVIAALGEPSGTVMDNNEEMLCYPGGVIKIAGDRVIYIDENFTFDKKPAKQPVAKAAAEPRQEKIKIFKEGGKEIELQKVIVIGKVTVVDFYADWCGPCRSIAPYLESLVNNEPDVYLRKIDIVDWGKPVVKQYSIKSVPNIRVFNRKGILVGEPTYDFNLVKEYVKKAK